MAVTAEMFPDMPDYNIFRPGSEESTLEAALLSSPYAGMALRRVRGLRKDDEAAYLQALAQANQSKADLVQQEIMRQHLADKLGFAGTIWKDAADKEAIASGVVPEWDMAGRGVQSASDLLGLKQQQADVFKTGGEGVRSLNQAGVTPQDPTGTIDDYINGLFGYRRGSSEAVAAAAAGNSGGGGRSKQSLKWTLQGYDIYGKPLPDQAVVITADSPEQLENLRRQMSAQMGVDLRVVGSAGTPQGDPYAGGNDLSDTIDSVPEAAVTENSSAQGTVDMLVQDAESKGWTVEQTPTSGGGTVLRLMHPNGKEGLTLEVSPSGDFKVVE